jgi:2-polyprenyl-6-methoxyphenol hydroxylase-like FAD-dependent oxidoreductase
MAVVLVTDPTSVPGLVSGGWSGWGRALAATRLLSPCLPEDLIGGPFPQAQPGEGSDDNGDVRWRVRSIAVASLERAAGRRWLAVGDAAAELDPVCGRGLYEALLDARDAARVIAAELDRGRDGVDQPSRIYADRVRQRAAAHRAERHGWYALERRWPDAPFWRARLSAPG